MIKWQKLGLIFSLDKNKLPENYIGFAQSPQAVVFENFIRIFFSTRVEEGEKMFRSEILFADFSLNLEECLNISQTSVIKNGDLGTFDEHGIFPISPYLENGKLVGYTCGWSRRVSVPVETSIGYVISDDLGLNFKRIGKGPILGPGINHPFLVGDAFVRKFNDVYHMWYIYGSRWVKNSKNGQPERIYKISSTTSIDGIHWEHNNENIIEDVLGVNECQALPSVIEHSGKYHMVFCYRPHEDFRNKAKNGYRLGYAYSEDLINWHRDDEYLGLDLPANGWDSEMMCYPNIFCSNNQIFLLYNGNAFGKQGFGAAKLLSW